MKRPSKPLFWSPAGSSTNGLKFILTGKEGKYQSIVENSIHAFFLTTSDGTILEINNAACKMFDYTPAELKELKRWDFIDHNDPRLLHALDLREKNGFAMTEAIGIKKNGNRFPVEITSAFFIDTDGIRKTSTMVSDISERKKTALAVEESEQRYKMFVQQSTEGIWRIDLDKAIHIETPLDGMINYCYNHAWVAECNDNFARMYGYEKAADVIGIPLNKILPADNPENMGYLVKFFSNGFKVENEISYETDKDGNQLILLNNMVGIIEGNYIKRAWGTQRNITEHKKAEEALAESENRLRGIIQTDPECIKLVSREGIILEMNPAGMEMVQADRPEQVIGKSGFDIILPAYKLAFENLLQRVFQGHEEKLVFQISGLKGRILWMETHCVPFRNTHGDITSMLSVTRDITESKNAQERLLVSEERYKYLFNNNPASIIIWDIDTFRILEVNETAVELYGYSKEQFLKLTVLDIRPDDEKKRLIDLLDEVKNGLHCKKMLRWRHIARSGNQLIMNIAAHRIQYDGKNAVLSLGNNITEKVLLENSLNEERKIRHRQITEAVITGQEKERTQLGEELHDNINQILASTKLYLECSLKDAKPRADLVNESKLLIEKAMTEIRKLSKTLLPPSLGEVGLLQALNELADNIKQVNELAIAIQWNDVNENELPNKLKLTIFRIIQEQLNNVIKHAGAKHVTVRISKSNGTLSISVKDDGQGFEPEQKRNGVGLRNITSRAEMNNGSVVIDSKPGNGCELTVNFVLRKTA